MGATRSLAAILFTDIVGYTAVVARSESQALGLREQHRKLVGECVARFRGRFFEETGDESLSTFASASDAVACALAIQEELAEDPALDLRVAVHLGEVLEQDGHLIGDAVNVAARIRPLAEPGGVCVSSRVWENVRNLEGLAATFLGDQPLKNVEGPVGVWSLRAGEKPPHRDRPRRSWLRPFLLLAGLLFLVVIVFAAVRPAREAVIIGLLRAGAVHMFPTYDQEVRFATTSDGVRLAWAAIGSGPPVLNASGWASHIERGFGSPGNNVIVPLLMDDHRVVVYDGRGFGLSDRDVADWSLEARVLDMVAVLDAAGVEKTGIIGLSSGALPAVGFAALHPERVERLLLYGAAARFGYSASDPTILERSRSLADLMRTTWDQPNPAFRELFASLFMPEADPFMLRAFDELQSVATDGEGIARFMHATLDIDLAALAPRVKAPTLVVHVLGDQIVPYAEARRLASRIPNARLVTFEGRNHVPLPGDPVQEALGDLIAEFFAEGAAAP